MIAIWRTCWIVFDCVVCGSTVTLFVLLLLFVLAAFAMARQCILDLFELMLMSLNMRRIIEGCLAFSNELVPVPDSHFVAS